MAIKKEWGQLSPNQHKESLVRDFLEPDSEYRRIGAYVRLGYYFPKELEPLVLKQLAEPRYDAFRVENPDSAKNSTGRKPRPNGNRSTRSFQNTKKSRDRAFCSIAQGPLDAGER